MLYGKHHLPPVMRRHVAPKFVKRSRPWNMTARQEQYTVKCQQKMSVFHPQHASKTIPRRSSVRTASSRLASPTQQHHIQQTARYAMTCYVFPSELELSKENFIPVRRQVAHSSLALLSPANLQQSQEPAFRTPDIEWPTPVQHHDLPIDIERSHHKVASWADRLACSPATAFHMDMARLVCTSSPGRNTGLRKAINVVFSYADVVRGTSGEFMGPGTETSGGDRSQ